MNKMDTLKQITNQEFADGRLSPRLQMSVQWAINRIEELEKQGQTLQDKINVLHRKAKMDKAEKIAGILKPMTATEALFREYPVWAEVFGIISWFNRPSYGREFGGW